MNRANEIDSATKNLRSLLKDSTAVKAKKLVYAVVYQTFSEDFLDSHRQVKAAAIRIKTVRSISSVDPSPPSGEIPKIRSMKSMPSSFHGRRS